LIVIDEIGKMELLSHKFREAVLLCMDSPAPVLGAILEARSSCAEEIKKGPEVQLITVTEQNRQALPGKLVSLIEEEGP
jgi:nucleoside-triphosphatase